jgi:hypothetical protein
MEKGGHKGGSLALRLVRLLPRAKSEAGKCLLSRFRLKEFQEGIRLG